MNYLPRFLLIIAGVSTSLLSADAGQPITNNLTVSMTMAFQQEEKEDSKSFYTPAPLIKQFTTKDLIAQLSKSFPTISTNKGTVLQAVSAIDEENAPVFFQARNADGVVTSIPSSVLSVTNGAVDLYGYTYPKSTGVGRSSSLSLLTVIYNDTTTETNQSLNGLRFSFNGVAKSSSTLTPTQIPNTFRVSQTGSQRAATGVGSFLNGVDTNASIITTDFIITSASFSIAGFGIITVEQ